MSGRIALTGEEYRAYLKEQGVTGTSSPFSQATNYREFTGLDRDVICNDTHDDLEITEEIIADCVPGAITKKDQPAP